MKKILPLNFALFSATFLCAQVERGQVDAPQSLSHISSQGNPYVKAAATNTMLIKDTLHYYLNKFYFKTATTEFTNFPVFKSAAVTVTTVTHCGSRFDVPAGETVTVTGLEAFAQKVSQTVHTSIPVSLYICNLNSQGMPVLPALDSVVTVISENFSGPNPVKVIGGDLSHGPVTMTTSFAVLIRNASTSSGDYVNLLRTAGTTATNTAADPATKCSDQENGYDYGYVRFNGTFYSTRDFTVAAGFGIGTAYEFVVAPRVEYEVQASQIVPSFIRVEGDPSAPDTVCARDTMIFTNTSSGFFEHRMYNLNSFCSKWNLYSAFPDLFDNTFSEDSSITWHFEFFDNPDHDESRVFLPYVNSHTISVLTDIAYYPNCLDANQFRARLRPMGALGKVPQFVFNENFKVCFKWCNGDTVGLKDPKNYDDLKIYPNPAINGKTSVSGLKGESTVIVYNMLGQMLLKEKTGDRNFEIDLSGLPDKVYIVKITGSGGQSKILRIINKTD